MRKTFLASLGSNVANGRLFNFGGSIVPARTKKSGTNRQADTGPTARSFDATKLPPFRSFDENVARIVNDSLPSLLSDSSPVEPLVSGVDEVTGPVTKADVKKLEKLNPVFFAVIAEASNATEATASVREILNYLENTFRDNKVKNRLEEVNAIEAIRTMRNIVAPSKLMTEESYQDSDVPRTTMELLYDVIHGKTSLVEKGFMLEMQALFTGVVGRSGIYDNPLAEPFDMGLSGRKAGQARSSMLNTISDMMQKKINTYKSGLDPEVIERRDINTERIRKSFGATVEQWNDYRWQLQNIVRDRSSVAKLIDLTPDEAEAIDLAKKNRLPFGITPYSISLMDKEPSRTNDHAIRAQVIPTLDYVKAVIEAKNSGKSLDFMHEGDTSPIDLVTRRYPQIAIIKPFNTCPQICVYCQRNWEIDDVNDPHALAMREKIDAAIEFYRQNPQLKEVLITGGDPGMMKTKNLEYIVKKFSELDHINAIRLGTRTPVTLPMRFDDGFVGMLAKYNEPGKRTLTVVTHFEHPYEVSPDARDAVKRLRDAGIPVVNQQVFTQENSRRFETAANRIALRKVGVDPYYTFNPKGKKETKDYLVPIARILMERKEEARLLPGATRTDEPVFNVPRLGKNHLRSWQDHRVIGVRPDGTRVYEFDAWEKNLIDTETYVHHEALSIAEYLERMMKRGEEASEYRNIWFYY